MFYIIKKQQKQININNNNIDLENDFNIKLNKQLEMLVIKINNLNNQINILEDKINELNKENNNLKKVHYYY